MDISIECDLSLSLCSAGTKDLKVFRWDLRYMRPEPAYDHGMEETVSLTGDPVRGHVYSGGSPRAATFDCWDCNTGTSEPLMTTSSFLIEDWGLFLPCGK
jgi:hypothetical protein